MSAERRDGAGGRAVTAFSFLFAYLLSFLFEGRALYALLEGAGAACARYILAAMAAHFLGLFTCGLFVKDARHARAAALTGAGACLPLTVPFFFAPSPLWILSLIASAYAMGCAVGAWGIF